MFVWRKRASAVWLAANEAPLREIGGQRLAIISRADRKSAIAEIAGSSALTIPDGRGTIAAGTG